MSMDALRNFSGGNWAKVLIGLLVISFAAWGIGDYLFNRMGAAALTVNGRDIALREVDGVYRNRVATITRMLGGTAPPPEVLAQLDVPSMVLTEVVHRAVLNHATEELGLVASPRQLRETVASNPAFRQDGAFSQARYRQATGQLGMTVSGYEKLLQADLSTRLMTDVVKVAVPAPQAVKPLVETDATVYRVETWSLAPAQVEGQLPPLNEDALQAFYRQNEEAYMVPEKRSIAVLSLGPSAVSGTITVSDEEIAARFEENRDAYRQPERRKVRHILVKDVKDAVELHEQIESRDAFIRLAGDKSIDPASRDNGGDLGEITADDVVPAFADVAFALDADTVSEPVQTPFGWHLIWVDEVIPASTPPLKTVEELIRGELIQEYAADALQDLLRTVDDAAAGGQNLTEIARQTGLPLKRHGLLTAESNTVDVGLVDAAFLGEKGRVEGPVTLENGELAYLEVTTIEPASVEPFKQVRPRIEADLKAAQVQNVLTAKAQALISAASEPAHRGKSLAEVARLINVEGSGGTETIENVADTPPWLHGALLDIYRLPVGAVVEKPFRQDDMQTVLRVQARNKLALEGDALESATNIYHRQLQQDMEALALQQMVAEAEVTYNPPVLRQVFGVQWNPPQ